MIFDLQLRFYVDICIYQRERSRRENPLPSILCAFGTVYLRVQVCVRLSDFFPFFYISVARLAYIHFHLTHCVINATLG